MFDAALACNKSRGDAGVSNNPPEASSVAFRKSRRVMSRLMLNPRGLSQVLECIFVFWMARSARVGLASRSIISAAGESGCGLDALCYHLLFSFRICRAGSMIPAGAVTPGDGI